MASPMSQPTLDPTRVHTLSPDQFKAKFREGTFAPNAYKEIQRRAAAAVGTNPDGLYEHNLVSPADKLVLGQIQRWQANFPEDVGDLGDYVTKTMSALRTKYTKAFYFWTAYNAARTHLQHNAVGNDFAEKQSAAIQANTACPGARSAYSQCSDVFHSIDITTRLSLPLQHQVTCREPFLALEQCLEHHMRDWSRTMRTMKRLEALPEYKQHYLELERQINGHEMATVVDGSDTDKDRALNMHLSLFRYDPDVVTDKDVQIAETLFEVKRLFPQEYLDNKEYYDALKRPFTPEQAEETKQIALKNNIDYSNLQLDTVIFNLHKDKVQTQYQNQ